MNFKKKLTSVLVKYEDGTTEEFEGDMRFNCWRNSRKRNSTGTKNQWWLEFFISWVEYEPEELKKARPVEDAPLPEPKLITEELQKDPSFAGIADNRVYYSQKIDEIWSEFDRFL